MSKNEYTCDCSIIHDDILNLVKDQMPTDEKLDRASLYFKVLGDKTRFTIVSALSKHEMCVCDIANLLSMTKSAVSHQLASLRKANLVTFRRDGKTIYYSLADEHVRKMLDASFSHVHQ